ncbi:MAG: flagellar biosynthesis anti-sigma factor FlgM [Planctomycetaceae bacterium]|nr:flagellar biosynthesis anti-sigma factor FlgM [Planctomycetaceae bacterium]
MEIQSTQYTPPMQNVQEIRNAVPVKSTEAQPSPQTVAQKDETTFSDTAVKLADSIRSEESESSTVRFELVNRVKKEIAAGTYDTPEKMDIALDRLLSRLNPS